MPCIPYQYHKRQLAPNGCHCSTPGSPNGTGKIYCFKNRGAIFAQAQKLVEPLRWAPSINDFVNPLLRHEYSARIQNEKSK